MNKRASVIVLLGIFLAVISGIAAALAGLGASREWWRFTAGLDILRWAAYGGASAAVLCGIGLAGSLRSRMSSASALAAAGLLIGLATAGIPWGWVQTAKRVPPIHDITTDTQNPPRFVAILPLRKDAMNPAEYGGPDIAALQLKAYPDIKPLQVRLSPAAAFDKALAAARELGWKVVDADKGKGRIEAVDRTFWFGFQDDIIMRIAEEAAGSRIDIRSVSRVGKSDIGTNAKRIRAFLKLMRG